MEITRQLQSLFRDRFDEPFLTDGVKGNCFTYRQFLGLALKGICVLESAGVHSGDRLVLSVHNSVELLVLYFACLLKGVVVIPIDPFKGKKEFEDILAQANTSHTWADWDIAAVCPQGRNCAEELNQLHAYRPVVENDLTVFEGHDWEALFLIAFTSGTSGKPKGVKHSFENLVLSAQAFRNVFKFDDGNVFYHNLPMTYMAGILNLFFLPLISGSRIVLGERFSVAGCARFWDVPIRRHVNTFWFIPAIASMLVKLDRAQEGVKYASQAAITGCIGTAPLSKVLREQFENKYNVRLYESYGLSETLFVSTQSPENKDMTEGVGGPLDGVVLDFLDDGEIMITTPWMFLGYENMPPQPRGAGFSSGDIGSVEQGCLKITGRKKELIIRGGTNISPRRLEEFLGAMGCFEEAVVMGIKDEVLGEKTACYYVPSAGGDIDRKMINDQIVTQLGRDYAIDQYIPMKDIPRNINGKVDRNKLFEFVPGVR